LKDPIIENGQNLYFRGHSNVVTALEFVNKLIPITLTNQFVLQGCSAGALSTFAWTDYFMNYVKSKNSNTNYWALADSAFYVDYKSLKTGDYDYKL
jgi:hypothetical protein